MAQAASYPAGGLAPERPARVACRGTYRRGRAFPGMTELHAKLALVCLAVVVAAAAFLMIRDGFRPTLAD